MIAKAREVTAKTSDAEATPDMGAAIFRPAALGGMRPTLAEAFALLRFALARRSGPQQGLLIAKSFYRQLGGHRSDAADPEAELLGRLGSRRTFVLRCLARPARPAIA